MYRSKVARVHHSTVMISSTFDFDFNFNPVSFLIQERSTIVCDYLVNQPFIAISEENEREREREGEAEKRREQVSASFLPLRFRFCVKI